MTIKKITSGYYLISGIYTLSAALIWGINTLFLLDAGLNIFEVFVANAVFTASMVLFEIPTGVLADTRGRRISFLLSVVILSIGTLGYVTVAVFFDGSLLLFCLMGIVLGLGFTFYSGAVEAWVVDALKSVGFTSKLDTVFIRASMINGIATLLGTLGGGIIGTWNLGIPYLIRAGLLILVFGIAWFFMKEIGFKPRALKFREIPKAMKKVALASILYGWGRTSVRLIMIFSFIQFSFFIWAWYAWQPYFLSLYGNPDAVWLAGIIAALVSFAMISGNFIAKRLIKLAAKRTTILLGASLIQSIFFIIIGLNNSFFISVLFYLFSMICFGITGPIKQSFLHQLIPTEQRATIVSFDSLIGSGGGVLGQTSFGFISQVYSIGFGFLTGGAFTLLQLPFLFLLRKQKEKADKFK